MNSPNTVDQQTVTRVLRQARLRRNPADIPGFAAIFGTPKTRGLTQAQTAHLVGVSKKWYGHLETGKPFNYSDTFLQAVRRVLDLDPSEWSVVYRLVRPGQAPPLESTPTNGPPVHESIRRFIEELRPWGAYLNDHRWDILAFNSAAVQDWPWMLHGTNVMEWALTFPEARTQLINWEEDWAKPMVAQLQLNAEQWKHDERLQEVIEKVLTDPKARELWTSPDLPALSHPSAHESRRLYLPRQGSKEFRMIFLAMEPMALPHHRLMALIPAQ